MRRWRLFLLAALVAVLIWLMRTPPPPNPLGPIATANPTETRLGAQFDASRCGSLSCRVEWSGVIPNVQPPSLIQAKVRPPGTPPWPNPNSPRISNKQGLADAVVCLRGIDPERSRPWDLPMPLVEISERDLHIRNGVAAERFGFARRGETIELVARESGSYSIRSRGAAFFNQMLVVPNRPVQRRFSDAGIVELSSGAWHYWMRAYLVVSDTPYVGVSNSDGVVQFDRVPDGEYEVVCWKANWHIAEIERDPEWVYQSAIHFHPAVLKSQRVRIVAGQVSMPLVFTFKSADFTPVKS